MTWQLKFWRFPHLDDLELLHASGITHDYPRHMHEEYSIAVVLRGTEITTCSGAYQEARPGDVLLINAEEVHASRSIASEYRLFKVWAKTFARLAPQSGEGRRERPSFPKLVVKDRLLFRMLFRLHLKLQHGGTALELESEFISTMALLLERQIGERFEESPAKPRREETHVQLVRDYLQKHYAENVSLSKLTALTNLSPFYLLRVFHNHVGFPPHEYQTQVRIAHARRFIRSGMPLSQTAVETGFFDQSHLSRNFKRIVGVTPRQYFRA